MTTNDSSTNNGCCCNLFFGGSKPPPYNVCEKMQKLADHFDLPVFFFIPEVYSYYLPATLRPSTSTLGAPKVVLPIGLGRRQLFARATMFFSSS